MSDAITDRDDATLSCQWLEAGLGFSPSGLHNCPVTHHGDRGWPLVAPFSGGPVPVDEIIASRERRKREVAAGACPECKDCFLLERKIWQPREYLVEVINICHSSACNLRCNYCYLQGPMPASRCWNDPENLRRGRTPYNIMPTILDMMDKGQIAPHTVINWAGGEPTMLEEFEELLERTMAFGMWQYLATNGTLFSEGTMRGILAGKVSVVCSVDAGTPETYRKMKERELFAKVWENLARYAREGRNVEAKYIFTPDNCGDKDILGFVAEVKKANIPQIICDVDAFNPTLTDEILDAYTAMRYEAEKLGIKAISAGCGVASFPENEVGKRSNRRMGSLGFRLFRRLKGAFTAAS